MLPLSHTYVSTKVTGNKRPLLIFGSILPDISTTSSHQIGRDKIHNAPNEFRDFINMNYPKFTDLSLGVCLHSQVGGGADFYSDDSNAGYAKKEGEKIFADVAALLEISAGDVSLGLAHNFIEMAVDLHLYRNHKEIWYIYKDAIENITPDLPKIAACMGAYLNLEQSLVLAELYNLIKFLNPCNLVSKELAVEKVVLPLIKLRFHKDVSTEKTLEIVDKALLITEPSYKEFLDKAVKEVKKNILSN